MTTSEEPPGAFTSPGGIDEALAQIEKGQQMAGHFPDEAALDRARRVLTGEATRDDAIAEIKSKYAQQ